MRKQTRFSFVLLISVLLQTQMNPQVGRSTKSMEKIGTFATRREFSKGGIGLVNERLYVVVRTEKTGRNELIVRPTNGAEETWHGKSITEPEVVFFYDGKVWMPSQALPDGFDLSRAIVVSFEKDKVRFFDFEKEYGAYYTRILD
jgi:hypothetical protein